MTNLMTKPWWQSRTIIASGVSIAALITGAFGVPIDDSLQKEIVELALVGTSVVSSAMAIAYRILAEKAIA
jgi:hypothetical protein